MYGFAILVDLPLPSLFYLLLTFLSRGIDGVVFSLFAVMFFPVADGLIG